MRAEVDKGYERYYKMLWKEVTAVACTLSSDLGENAERRFITVYAA